MVEQAVVFMVAVSLPLMLVVEQIARFGTPGPGRNAMRRFARALLAVALCSIVPAFTPTQAPAAPAMSFGKTVIQLSASLSFPQDVVVADFDGRNGPDIAVLGSSGDLEIYRNRGDGTFEFSSSRPPACPASGGVSLFAGQFSADTNIDLLIVCNDIANEGFKRYRGFGDGTFANVPDAVVVPLPVGFFSDPNDRLFGAGGQLFGRAQLGAFGGSGQALTYVEWIPPDQNDYILCFFRVNELIANFDAGGAHLPLCSAPVTVPGPPSVDPVTGETVPGDPLDVGPEIRVGPSHLLAAPPFSWPETAAFTFPLTPNNEFPLAGNLRAVVYYPGCSLPPAPTLVACFSFVDYLYSNPTPGTAPGAAGDFNHDGVPEIVALIGDYNFAVFAVEPSQQIQPGVRLIPDPLIVATDPALGFPTFLSVADFDGDGNLDVAVLSRNSNAPIQIFRGNGDGTFGPAQYFPTDDFSGGLMVADLNGDGRPDLVHFTFTNAGRFLTVHLNTTPASCAFTINPSSQAFGPAGGSNSVAVTAPGGCAWTAASDDPGVVTVTSGASGSGPGTVGYTVSANSGPARPGKLTIAGQTFTIDQGSGCTFSIAPSSRNFPAGGGTDSVNVSTGADCPWTTSSSDSAVATISAGATGKGSGPVSYAVSANSGIARSAFLTIAGQTFSVTQDSGCTFAILPTSAKLGLAGGTGSVTVTTSAGCGWTAVSLDPSWLTVTSGASGSGPGTVGYSVSANTGPARSSSIGIGGQSFAVSQDGITAINTSTGVNVGVSLLGGAIRVFFPGVMTAGVTTVTLTDPCQPTNPCRLPAGYVRFGNLAFDIQTTAVTTGPITLAFDLSQLATPNPITPQLLATLRVLHGEGSVLVDRTSPIMPTDPIIATDPARTIFARVASLSPFVIAQLGPQPLLQVAHDRLVVLRQGTTDPRKGRALEVAIGALNAALAPAHWIDPFHVTPAGGVSTAIDTALAVASLAAYRSDPAVHLAIDQILGADLELVRTAITTAGGR
jgi:hypothetical protein